jgi:WhiB family redox-sensing transcriptional regulator
MNRPTPGAVAGTTSTRSSSVQPWPLRGACRDADPELFFTPEGERGTMREYREADAKAVCAGCLAECRASALEERIPYGVWGGLSETERTAILDAGPGGAVTKSAPAGQRAKRRTRVIQELVQLADEGYSRDEVIVTLRVAGNWLTRICNDAGRGDLLEKLDANASRPRHEGAA